MRDKTRPLPSEEETDKETKLRLNIVQSIEPELEKFSEAVILVGSLAYGKYFSVRKESDIDLIILINRPAVEYVLSSELFSITPQYDEAIRLFKNKTVDHFTIKEMINGVEVQYHFWDKEAHFKVELYNRPIPKSYKSMRPIPKFLVGGSDFSGEERKKKIGKVDIYSFGIAYKYPAYFIDDDRFVPKEPITNLIADPEILFSKDGRLYGNIDKIWENLTRRLIKESKSRIDLRKMSIFNSIYGNWNMSEDSKERIKQREKQELIKLGVSEEKILT